MTPTSSDNLIRTEPVWATVKWFDPLKGFGFVICEEGGADVLLHSNVLRNYGRASVTEGTRLKAKLIFTPRGAQVTEILDIEAPLVDQNILDQFVDIDAEEIATIEYEPARVKWFNKLKGYGFANAFMESEDVFLHSEIMYRSGLGILEPGEAIAVKVIEGERGLIAVEICSWLEASKTLQAAH